jgi:ribosomal protein L16 Arg81 hydroxylase
LCVRASWNKGCANTGGAYKAHETTTTCNTSGAVRGNLGVSQCLFCFVVRHGIQLLSNQINNCGIAVANALKSQCGEPVVAPVPLNFSLLRVQTATDIFQQNEPDMSATFSFDWAIAPETPDTFFAEHFEKKPLLVKRNAPSYFADLLSFTEIDLVVSTMGLSHPEVNVTRSDGNITPADFAYETGQIDPVRVNQLYADGATVILSGLHERLPQLARYCRAMEAAMSARVQTNIYMTPPGNQGFNPHYDSHDVLVLQVQGTKEWRVYGTPIELPLNDQGFERGMDVGEEVMRFLLEPGDTLYLPRGMAHDAVATDDTSLHITTGLMFRTWADVLAEAVVAKAHREPAMRRALPPGYANEGADLDAFNDTYAEIIALLGDAHVGKLLSGFRDEFLTGRVPRVEGQMAQLAMLDGLTVDSRIGGRPHIVYAFFNEEDEQVRLTAQGAEIVLPAFAKSAMEFCLTNPDFRLGDMGGELDDDGKLVLARRMVREGLVQVL